MKYVTMKKACQTQLVIICAAAVINPTMLSIFLFSNSTAAVILHPFARERMQVYNFPAAALFTAGIAGRG
ncbi:hypothetical protein [Rhizobium ruizarguesonis]|uniref:hypothetical protein n=1 Tax=Rhizobium ruizarguesonis TaxID=2081791 RepID=UPI001031B94D|nr:hypothetical protein [Rhizobium ruizarguesonis]TBC68497.1 hypothetical protein ELH30_30300 [Rhizobium ruizarguesonis]TBC71072.1 hypothetical protein ELH28_32005 [Rhizobium ruizarguesonis]TBE01469.1 hypothetical protein ELH10_10955 [Rhizobium ruizarguesonis]TBF01843.1 hypothetical protein ELG95_36520 [Rhizobium ruizarguesonis]